MHRGIDRLGRMGRPRAKVRRHFQDWLTEDGFSVELANTTAAFADPLSTNSASSSRSSPCRRSRSGSDQSHRSRSKAASGSLGASWRHGRPFRECVQVSLHGGRAVGGASGRHHRLSCRRDEAGRPDHGGQFPASPTCSEQYYLHADPSSEVLATTTFSGDPCAGGSTASSCPSSGAEIQEGQSVLLSSLDHQASRSRGARDAGRSCGGDELGGAARRGCLDPDVDFVTSHGRRQMAASIRCVRVHDLDLQLEPAHTRSRCAPTLARTGCARFRAARSGRPTRSLTIRRRKSAS